MLTNLFFNSCKDTFKYNNGAEFEQIPPQQFNIDKEPKNKAEKNYF